jgi:Zeta toxin
MSTPTEIEYWPPRAEHRAFDWSQPTCDVYKYEDTRLFTERFRDGRSRLDYSYHKNPILERQLYQDTVLSRILEADSDQDNDSATALESDVALKSHKRPFLVFTAGSMGAGKSYVLSQLHQKEIFPLQKFVKIDPDMLKSELPEMAGYLQHDSESAATKLHRESTQMSDVLFEHSLMKNRNILVDGSLRDTEWYQHLFQRLRNEFPQYMLCILYISASPQTIKDRAHERAKKSDRTVPEDVLQESIEQVPRSVQILCPLTDHTFEITNDDDQPMALKEWVANDEASRDDNIDKSEKSWNYFGQIWQRPSRPQEVKEENEHEKESLQHLFCHMMEHLSCPIRSKKEFECAKSIWGKAYPSFCPRCTLSSDQQCT